MPTTQFLTAAHRKLLLEILARLVAADTINPPGNECRVTKIVASFLRRIDVPFQTHAKQPGRTNILWALGHPGRPEIFVAAHSDTVPPGDNWQTDPLTLVRKKGDLIGRGVVDNKGVLAGLLVATKLLKKISRQLPYRFVFAAVADEEHGSEFGLQYLLTKKFVQPDAAIIPDVCGNNRIIVVAEKGILHLRVVARGRQGHGSMPELSLNAFYVLDELLTLARKIKFTRRTKMLAPATLSVGAVRAGTVANIIPGRAEALIDIRYPPNDPAGGILRQLENLAARVAKKWGAPPFEFEVIQEFPASETAAAHPLVDSALRAIRTAGEHKPSVVGIPAFTVAGFLRAKKIPTISFGPGEIAECHRSNERLPEREVFEFTAILMELLKTVTLK